MGKTVRKQPDPPEEQPVKAPGVPNAPGVRPGPAPDVPEAPQIDPAIDPDLPQHPGPPLSDPESPHGSAAV